MPQSAAIDSVLDQSRMMFEEVIVGSVIATWSGQCRDQLVQEELVAHLHEIAAFTQAYAAPELPVERIDGWIEGKILVDPTLLPEGDRSIGNDGLGRFPRLRLYGLAFRPLLYLNLYRGHDNFGFMFIRAPDRPELDGRLVHVVRGDILARYDHEAVRSADAWLAEPSIHLRYQFEAWTDRLMNWIRSFFIEDLQYWRYEEDKRHDGSVFAPQDVDRRAARWLGVKLAYLDEATNYIEVDQAVRKATRRAKDLPWNWLAEQRLGNRLEAHIYPWRSGAACRRKAGPPSS